NYITGVIMGKVVEITESGLYKIEGEKEIDVNGSKQIIKISGYVRNEDISEENTIYSSNISDMKLTFIGKGFIEEKRKPGILTRLFNLFF
ncbi:MAG: flagellar basal body L-ring protein FlgH, partial [bacterium]|nr:flagellar basal body L-ring protein FlgH [bacterium]MDW8164213.1 flagellar basal body L-ring protein FlgH [Candidatus Omnitrophota bacterium]